MLHGVWLLSDLDGTLISTPHKARGQYLSLEQSPCLHAIKRWLLNGGNVCIITTADKRAIHQVYTPLQPILKDSSGRGNCGELLLSLYTGAVLYCCSASGVEVVREYSTWTHRATGESLELAELYGLPMKKVDHGNDMETVLGGEACVHGTCISRNNCNTLLDRVENIFGTFAEEVLRGEATVLSALASMSARYKEVWRLLLDYMDARYTAHSTGSVTPVSLETGKKKGHDEEKAGVAWKCNFLRQRRFLFKALGIIRVQLVDSRAATVTGTSERINTAAQRLKAKVLRVLGDDSSVSSAFVDAMLQLLGAEQHDDDDDDENNEKAKDKDVAQVMVLGVPLRLFSRYFRPHLEAFARIGVTAIPQPNSVVFAKMGVCKSTVIRYLIGEPQPLKEQACVVRPRMYGVLDISRAVALGDNPHSTDFELTVFPRLPFISLEMMEQRRKRHARINSISASATKTTAPATKLRPRRGFTMDDRYVPNLHYVGGEEHGTAAFLTMLMDALHVPSDASEAERQPRQQQVQSEAFTSALLDAVAKAVTVVPGSLMGHL